MFLGSSDTVGRRQREEKHWVVGDCEGVGKEKQLSKKFFCAVPWIWSILFERRNFLLAQWGVEVNFCGLFSEVFLFLEIQICSTATSVSSLGTVPINAIVLHVSVKSPESLEVGQVVRWALFPLRLSYLKFQPWDLARTVFTPYRSLSMSHPMKIPISCALEKLRI